MINPRTREQGYDALINYDASKNVGITLPLLLVSNQSLVTIISNSDGGVGNKPFVNTAAVLTCLTSAPPSGSFRPGISASTKTLHNISSLDYSKLSKLAVPSGQNINAASLTSAAAWFQMPWLDHDGAFTVQYMHPTGSGLPSYDFPLYFSTAALMLHLNFTDAEKRKLLINFIQLGIDEYSFIEAGPTGDLSLTHTPYYGWETDGGHSQGRKWPIMFAGIMLNYDPMKNIGQKSGDYLYSNGHYAGNPPSDYVYFAEDGQTFYVAQTDIDTSHSVGWNPNTSDGTPYPYIASMIGMPEWGIRHNTYPTLDNSTWQATYRTIFSGPPSWAGTVMAARIMGAKSLWNHNAHFDFIDRYMAITAGLTDPFGYTVTTQVAGGRPGDLVGAMWDTYRIQYNDAPIKHLRISTGCLRRADGSCWAW